MSSKPTLFTSSGRRAAAFLFGLALATAPTWAVGGTVLYSTSFEAPEFTPGLLAGQGGWYANFSNNAMVTSSFAQTGSQSVEIDKLDTNVRLDGPWSSPLIDFEWSVFIDGPGDADAFEPGFFFTGSPIGPRPDPDSRPVFVGHTPILNQGGNLVATLNGHSAVPVDVGQ